MKTLTSAEFSRRFQDKSIDLSKVREDGRVGAATAHALSHADSNKNGKIEGHEVKHAFRELDNFDKNGSSSSVNVGELRAPSALGKTVAAMTEAATPRRGLGGGGGGGSSRPAPTGSDGSSSTRSATSDSSGTQRRADAYANGRRTSIETKSIGGGRVLQKDAANAFNRMREAALGDGVNLNVVSSFRTMDQQRALYRAYQNGTGNLAARPGYSNHQSGIAVDVQTNNSRNSAAYRWLAQNGAQFGFANTVRSEPWHWEFRR